MRLVMEDAPSELSGLAERINRTHEACGKATGRALSHAIECGRLLNQAKSLCPHGQWLPWLKEHFDGSTDTAAVYRRLAERAHELSAAMTIDEALRTLATPKRSVDTLTNSETTRNLYEESRTEDGPPPVPRTRAVIRAIDGDDADELHAPVETSLGRPVATQIEFNPISAVGNLDNYLTKTLFCWPREELPLLAQYLRKFLSRIESM